MHWRGVLVALASFFFAAYSGYSCTGYVPCTGTYFATIDHYHESEVDVSVDCPELESAEWVLDIDYVEDRPSERGSYGDLLNMYVSQADYPNNGIRLSGYVTHEGILEEITTEGTVTVERADGYMWVRFDNLVLLGGCPYPGDPPTTTSVTLNGDYKTAYDCQSAS